jgi:mycofactocin glycosyltransferase
VSVVVPARNEGPGIGQLVRAVSAQAAGARLEVIVVDDGSTDGTAASARDAGARVLARDGADGGNPAAARNLGAGAATGDILVFLDADCTPAAGWLQCLLARHADGESVVGGALDLPPGLRLSARLDYYCGWYHVHSRRLAGHVPNHPPGNLSVRRSTFAATEGFTERQPAAYAHEELAWQSALARSGIAIWFEPRAIVRHRNRPGFRQLLRRNYRWGYSSLEAKAASGATRLRWLAQHPRLQIAAAAPLALAQAGYIVACWARVGVFEPLLFFPLVLAARVAYVAGLVAGGWRWLSGVGAAGDLRPRWE